MSKSRTVIVFMAGVCLCLVYFAPFEGRLVIQDDAAAMGRRAVHAYLDSVDTFVGDTMGVERAEVDVHDRAASLLMVLAAAIPVGCGKQEARPSKAPKTLAIKKEEVPPQPRSSSFEKDKEEAPRPSEIVQAKEEYRGYMTAADGDTEKGGNGNGRLDSQAEAALALAACRARQGICVSFGRHIESLGFQLAENHTERDRNRQLEFERRIVKALGPGSSVTQAEQMRALAKDLTRAGLFKQALLVVGRIEDSEQKSYALQEVTSLLCAGGHADPPEGNAIAETLAVARTITDPAWQVITVQQVALSAAQAKLELDLVASAFKEATEAANRLNDAVQRSEVMCGIAVDLVTAGLDRKERVRVFKLSLAAAGKINDAAQKMAALERVVSASEKAGLQPTQMAGILVHSRNVADGIPGQRRKAEALDVIADAMARSGMVQEARSAASAISDADLRSTALRKVAAAMARAGEVTEALEVVRGIDNMRAKADAFGDVVSALSGARLDKQNMTAILRKLLDLAASFKNTPHAANAVVRLTPEIVRARLEKNELVSMFGRLLKIAGKISEAQETDRVLKAISVQIVKAGLSQRDTRKLLKKTTRLAHKLKTRRDKSKTLRHIASSISLAGGDMALVRKTLGEAAQAARGIKSLTTRAEVLANIASEMLAADSPRREADKWFARAVRAGGDSLLPGISMQSSALSHVHSKLRQSGYDAKEVDRIFRKGGVTRSVSSSPFGL